MVDINKEINISTCHDSDYETDEESSEEESVDEELDENWIDPNPFEIDMINNPIVGHVALKKIWKQFPGEKKNKIIFKAAIFRYSEPPIDIKEAEKDDLNMIMTCIKQWRLLQHVRSGECREEKGARHGYRCCCSQRGLADLFYIRNTINGNILLVGSICIGKVVPESGIGQQIKLLMNKSAADKRKRKKEEIEAQYNRILQERIAESERIRQAEEEAAKLIRQVAEFNRQQVELNRRVENERREEAERERHIKSCPRQTPEELKAQQQKINQIQYERWCKQQEKNKNKVWCPTVVT